VKEPSDGAQNVAPSLRPVAGENQGTTLGPSSAERDDELLRSRSPTSTSSLNRKVTGELCETSPIQKSAVF